MFIRNYEPTRWPNGTPRYQQATIRGAWYADTDASPTKNYMIENRDKDAIHQKLYRCAFAKRPAEELYDMTNDPWQIKNVAADPAYRKIKEELADEAGHHVEKNG